MEPRHFVISFCHSDIHGNSDMDSSGQLQQPNGGLLAGGGGGQPANNSNQHIRLD